MFTTNLHLQQNMCTYFILQSAIWNWPTMLTPASYLGFGRHPATRELAIALGLASSGEYDGLFSLA